jgi:hypothetical protein
VHLFADERGIGLDVIAEQVRLGRRQAQQRLDHDRARRLEPIVVGRVIALSRASVRAG